jgi:hypothetical protein
MTQDTAATVAKPKTKSDPALRLATDNRPATGNRDALARTTITAAFLPYSCPQLAFFFR